MRDLLEEDIPEPSELVANVLHQGSKLILGGASKSYKTWVLIDLAVSVSTGVPWLGFPTTEGKVLYVNLEIQKAFFRRRNRDVLGAKQLMINHRLEAWNLRGWAADYRILLPKIEERIRDQNYALVILDPTYKLLGDADENNATDISALLNRVESLAVSTGAAIAMAGHFAKGNPSAKETIDRISGSGVFARDPDSLIIFTKHEEEGAFAVEMVLRNFRPIPPFVVRWDYPVFRRAENLDPTQLKRVGGRPRAHSAETLLRCLGDNRLRTADWKVLAKDDYGVSESRFYALLNELEHDGKVQKSAVDGKWYQIQPISQNSKR